MPHSGRHLQADRAVGLAEMLASFAVAELDQIEPTIPEHHRRDLASPGAGIGPVHVLRADLDACRCQRLLDLANRCEGRDDERLDALVESRHETGQRPSEVERLG